MTIFVLTYLQRIHFTKMCHFPSTALYSNLQFTRCMIWYQAQIAVHTRSTAHRIFSARPAQAGASRKCQSKTWWQWLWWWWLWLWWWWWLWGWWLHCILPLFSWRPALDGSSSSSRKWLALVVVRQFQFQLHPERTGGQSRRGQNPGTVRHLRRF